MKFFRCTSEKISKYKDQFVELYKQLIYVHYPEKVDQGILTTLDFKKSIDKISNYIDAQEGVVFVAQEEEVICGYAHGYIRMFLDEKRMMLDGIVVKPEYKRNKIGHQLLNELEKYAKQEKCDVMELFVTTNNPSAESFYRNKGFVDSRLHMIKSL